MYRLVLEVLVDVEFWFLIRFIFVEYLCEMSGNFRGLFLFVLCYTIVYDTALVAVSFP